MAALTPFDQQGPTLTFAVGGAASTPQRAPSADSVGNQQYVLTNSGTKLCFVGMGANAGQATANTVAPVEPQAVGYIAQCYPVLAGSQVTITGQQNAFFSAICAGSDTTTLLVTPGYGQ